jgi:hypothetical protein
MAFLSGNDAAIIAMVAKFSTIMLAATTEHVAHT